MEFSNFIYSYINSSNALLNNEIVDQQYKNVLNIIK